MLVEPGSPVSKQPPQWRVGLLVFSVVCAILVALSWLIPVGTSLWQLVLLAAGITILVVHGPEMLSKVLAAGSWIAGDRPRPEDPSA